jgi:hypothetical protein
MLGGAGRDFCAGGLRDRAARCEKLRAKKF